MKPWDDSSGYRAFLREDVSPPESLESIVLSRVSAALHPRLGKTLAKLFLLNLTGSFVTLLLCPQFGVSLTGGEGLMPYLMNIHPALCFFLCGSLWMIFGQSMAYLLLSIDEQRVLGRTRWGVGLAIPLLTVLGFGCLGRISVDEWLAVWAVGAILVVGIFNGVIGSNLKRVSSLSRQAKPRLP